MELADTPAHDTLVQATVVGAHNEASLYLALGRSCPTNLAVNEGNQQRDVITVFQELDYC